MPLSVRKRGAVWHARGTVRVGTQVVTVPEFSTGCDTRAAAEAVAAAREAEVRADILDGSAGRARRTTIADCLLDYLKRPKGVEPYDQARIADFNERIGARPLTEAVEAWGEWLRTRGTSMGPAAAARWRGVLVAALRVGCALRKIEPPKLPPVEQDDEVRVRYLSYDEQESLLASYNRWAARPVLLLCYQGLRSQEALQLQWADVDLGRGTLFVRPSKNGQARTLPMHPRVRGMLEKLEAETRIRRGSAPTGAVFLSQRGKPYADTRDVSERRRHQGGNPLAQAHATALAAAGIDDFRLHDWRHHWASLQVMNGTDLITLQKMGGWKDHRSVLRYAAVSMDHMAQAIARMR